MTQKKNRFIISILLFLSLFFISCNQQTKTHKKAEDTRYFLDESVFWAPGALEQTVDQAATLNYTPLDLGYCNLYDILGRDPTYIWVKITFTLPENLKNQTLGFVIPYLHYSEKAWLNNFYLGNKGTFHPKPYSALFASHYYMLPDEAVNQNGENTIYLQVLSQGLASISDGIFIDKDYKAFRSSNMISFHHSKLYMLFEGILICAMIFFFILFLARPSELYILNFSLICLSTVFFMAYFWGQELPGYGDGIISMLGFTKITLCICFYLTIFTIVAFMFNFVKVEQPKYFVIFKFTVVFITIVITLLAPDISFLMKLTVPMIITYALHFILGLGYVIKALFEKEHRKSAIILILGFTPLAVTMLADVIVRNILRNINYPYFAIFGWETTVTFFIIYLSLEYNKVFLQNKKLNTNLQQEVNLRTADLSKANESLEQKQYQSERELEMASVVQQKFFTPPNSYYKGWNVELEYKPLEKVSGDLYDFYSIDDNLNGFGLFDASGHGVSAALITMLSKNIILRMFQEGSQNNLSLSQILSNIDTTIRKSKGKVDNYLTGLLFRLNNIDETQSIVELSNAGHPYPILYSKEENKLISLKEIDSLTHYGAIALSDLESHFTDINFKMKTGDILVCYSDGLTELKNSEQELFGRNRLEQIVLQYNDLSPTDLLKKINQITNEFIGSESPDDDITIIILKKIDS